MDPLLVVIVVLLVLWIAGVGLGGVYLGGGLIHILIVLVIVLVLVRLLTGRHL